MSKIKPVGRNIIVPNEETPLLAFARIPHLARLQDYNLHAKTTCPACGNPIAGVGPSYWFPVGCGRIDLMLVRDTTVFVGCAKGSSWKKRHKIAWRLFHNTCFPSARAVIEADDCSAHELYMFYRDVRKNFLADLYPGAHENGS